MQKDHNDRQVFTLSIKPSKTLSILRSSLPLSFCYFGCICPDNRANLRKSNNDHQGIDQPFTDPASNPRTKYLPSKI